MESLNVSRITSNLSPTFKPRSFDYDFKEISKQQDRLRSSIGRFQVCNYPSKVQSDSIPIKPPRPSTAKFREPKPLFPTAVLNVISRDEWRQKTSVVYPISVCYSERPGKFVVNTAHSWQSNPAYKRTEVGNAFTQ
mmetsp:Transcript_18768/g.34026  ORF Transcript_18768/g.34026 Transcript_18768/m.34026 type:complete len:136 (+) Transcript_18768:1184-1591(+)